MSDFIGQKEAESGIYLTVLRVGEGNLIDNMMEQITNKGNGNYEYIDNAKQIQKVFNYESGKFYTIAKDSKIPITFYNNMVDSYRLIGYKNRSLDTGKFAQFDFRYKKPNETQSRLLTHEIIAPIKDINESSENMRFSSTLAGFG